MQVNKLRSNARLRAWPIAVYAPGFNYAIVYLPNVLYCISKALDMLANAELSPFSFS